MGQKVSPPYQDCSPLSPWPSSPWSSWWKRSSLPVASTQAVPLRKALIISSPSPQWLHTFFEPGDGQEASTYHSILVPADRGEKSPQNHSEKKEGREGPASKEMQTSCYNLTTRTSVSLLSTLQKFTVPELKLSSKPPSARHYDPASFTGKTRGPRRGGVMVQPISLKSWQRQDCNPDL